AAGGARADGHAVQGLLCGKPGPGAAGICAVSVPCEQSPGLAALSGARHGFFGRNGGSSVGDFAENNMSIAVGDTPHLVEANRSAAAQTLGYLRKNLYLLKQV